MPEDKKTIKVRLHHIEYGVYLEVWKVQTEEGSPKRYVGRDMELLVTAFGVPCVTPRMDAANRTATSVKPLRLLSAIRTGTNNSEMETTGNSILKVFQPLKKRMILNGQPSKNKFQV